MVGVPGLLLTGSAIGGLALLTEAVQGNQAIAKRGYV